MTSEEPKSRVIGPPLTQAHRMRRNQRDNHSTPDSSLKSRSRGIPATIQEDAITDLSAPSSRGKESLTGSGLKDRAFHVTRRLSHSVYMMQNSNNMQGFLAKRRQTLQASSVSSASQHYEPTYRMLPERRFNAKQAEVEDTIRDVLEMHLRGRDYDPHLAPLWTTQISGELNDRMKMLDMPRYRFICHVIVGQRQENSLYMASQCAWDDQLDSFGCAEYESPSLIAIGTVHGVYLE